MPYVRCLEILLVTREIHERDDAVGLAGNLVLAFAFAASYLIAPGDRFTRTEESHHVSGSCGCSPTLNLVTVLHDRCATASAAIIQRRRCERSNQGTLTRIDVSCASGSE